ncbi:MAG: sulfotransferase domain-containing protein [Bacteroidota bacterium]|nr:sulfotransferase domain-containing protein [Bacteroidota bacterium]
MKTPIRQYIRYLLVKLGLFDKGAFLLSIDAIYPDDLFLVSYPKSGNTWLRFLIANMINNKNNITFNNIDEYVHGLYSARDKINQKKKNRIIKSHHPYFNHYPKTVYICRDLRDTLVSYYHYQVALKEFSGTLSDFIHSPKHTDHPYGSWSNHIITAFEKKKEDPESILIIRYEDLHTDPSSLITELSHFCGIPLSLPISEIINRCSFDSLKKNENTFGSDFKKQSGHNFFREGKSASWKEHFSSEDLKWLIDQPGNAAALSLAGYPLK